jgi:hypothetical protein
VALEVDGDDGVPRVFFHLEAHGVAQDPGVVDQDVEATQLLDGGAHDVGPARPGGDVVAAGQALAPAGDDLVHHRLGRRPVHVVDHHRGALGGEEQRLAPPDAPAGAGDDGHLPVESTHPRSIG